MVMFSQAIVHFILINRVIGSIKDVFLGVIPKLNHLTSQWNDLILKNVCEFLEFIIHN